jgi:hypothetical protein
MMDAKADRREVARKFKEHKPLRGAFAVRCTATGRVWVGSYANLDAMRNRLWFSLREGLHRDKTLQEEWNTHAEETFEYEILEKLDDDVSALELGDRLKELRLRWAAQLGAGML